VKNTTGSTLGIPTVFPWQEATGHVANPRNYGLPASSTTASEWLFVTVSGKVRKEGEFQGGRSLKEVSTFNNWPEMATKCNKL